MGAEPASPGAMHRSPRPLDQHILGGGAWQLRSILETEPLGRAGAGPALACAPAGFPAARLVRTAFPLPGPTGRGSSSGLR
ncbi:hypothetical protein ACFTUC_12240 [Streptomyces sp. NPDC056944]|uniref:hypothetical protein n=1 Tax=Streptomyces sp. NPDC056944 TaxID=3345972 RepID=UPI003633066A